MRIKFIKPLPRTDRVIPAGYILDAPEGFARKMVQTGRAVFVTGKNEEIKPVEETCAPAPVEVHEEVPEEAPVEAPVEASVEAPEAPAEVEEAPKPKRTRKRRDAE